MLNSVELFIDTLFFLTKSSNIGLIFVHSSYWSLSLYVQLFCFDSCFFFPQLYRIKKGRGVTRNDTIAAKWYRKAADQHDAKATCNLGVLYDQGK